ncbi:MAG: hypothetical protein A2132_07400 [Nitrospirae bacterium RBG_16_43_11]|nr:MAG: hypothetical protein A2132_07400 [Nitrospirae bacterium RBG_16_43_11]
MAQTVGPICQSCGMAIQDPNDFGTTASGAKNLSYCRYCFLNGKFTDPDITLEQMIEKCTGIAATKKNMTEDKAKEIVSDYMPKLKRWYVKAKG